MVMLWARQENATTYVEINRGKKANLTFLTQVRCNELISSTHHLSNSICDRFDAQLKCWPIHSNDLVALSTVDSSLQVSGKTPFS